MNRLIGLLMAAAVFLAAPALAQPNVVTVTATPERTQVTPGDRLAVAVVMEFKEGYHAWPAEAQKALAPEIAEFAFHTNIVAGDLPAGIEAVGEVQWPQPHEVMVADPTGAQPTVKANAYSGRAIAYVPVAIAANASPGPVTLELTVSYQVCDDKMCLMPEDKPVRVTLEVVSDAAAAASSATDPSLFSGFDARALAKIGTNPASPDGAATAGKSAAAAASPRPSLFGY